MSLEPKRSRESVSKARSSGEEPDDWRDRLLRRILRIGAILAPLIYLPSLWMALRVEQVGTAVVDTIAVVILYGLHFGAKDVAFRPRAVVFVSMLYGLATWLLIAVGSISQIYLLGFSVLTTLLLGFRWGVATIVLNAATLLAIGASEHASPEMTVLGWDMDFAGWVVVTLNFVLVNALLTGGVGLIIATLERALVTVRAAHEALELEHHELMSAHAGLQHEIAERSRVDAALRLQGAALENAANSIVITDAEGRLRWANPAFSATTGYTEDEAIGRNPHELVRSGAYPDTFYDEIWETLRGGAVWRGEVIGRRKDGSLYHEEQAITPLVRDGEITHFVAVMQDVSEQRTLQGQLLQAQKMEAVGRLAGGVAHDFNNMLSIIMGHASLALEMVGDSDPIRDDLRDIVDASRRATELTKQLLTFAREHPISPRPLDLNAVVARGLKMLRRLIGENIELSWKPGEVIWPVKMDPVQIDQILTNLVVNARDAIDGPGTLTVRTDTAELDDDWCSTHAGTMPGEFSVLMVSDSGIGMDTETLARLFEPFFTTKTKGQGTGLGLSTVYGIVKQNHGFINVYSEPGRGTLFKIYLPRHLGGEVQPEATPSVTGVRGGSEVVLLVEDEEALLSVSRRYLEKLGYVVLVAGGAREALALAASYQGTIDLLMTDVVMPEMSGREVRETLADTHPVMKCLYVSGYTADILGDDGVLDEGVSFLQKPFGLHRLARKLREVLDS